MGIQRLNNNLLSPPGKLDKKSVSSCVCLHENSQWTCKRWFVESLQKFGAENMKIYKKNQKLTYAFTVPCPGLISALFIQCM